MKGGKSRSGSKVKSRFYIFLPAIIIIHHRIGLKFLNFNQNPQLNRQILTTKIHYSFEISKFRWNSVERSGANQSYSTRLARRSIGYTGWICWWLDKWFFRILCGGVISWTAIAGEGHSKSNPTRTVHPFHGWIFQFRGIFVARVGQFERTKEAVDPGENWPSLSVFPSPPSPCRTNNSGARMKISRPTPWPARISGYHENIPRPRRCRGYWDFSLPF